MEALKYDTGKLPWRLMPIEGIRGMLRVLQYGMRKYTKCLDCGKKVYPNPRLDGDPDRKDCPHCGSTNIYDGANNWREGFDWSRLIDSAYRHLDDFFTAEDTDKESGLPVIDHLMCCVVFLSVHQKCGYGVDDRWHAKEGSSVQNNSSVQDKVEDIKSLVGGIQITETGRIVMPKSPFRNVPPPKDGTVIEGDWGGKILRVQWDHAKQIWVNPDAKNGESGYVSIDNPIKWRPVEED